MPRVFSPPSYNLRFQIGRHWFFRKIVIILVAYFLRFQVNQYLCVWFTFAALQTCKQDFVLYRSSSVSTNQDVLLVLTQVSNVHDGWSVTCKNRGVAVESTHPLSLNKRNAAATGCLFSVGQKQLTLKRTHQVYAPELVSMLLSAGYPPQCKVIFRAVHKGKESQQWYDILLKWQLN